MEKPKREMSVLDGHSPVNRYELMCVDKLARGEIGPDEEKMMVAFEAFDALIPGLGVYTRIFRKLRDDMFDAVYSDDLTTFGDSVMRVPYFTHIHRRQNQQSQKLDEMEDQLETVKKRLFEKHKQFEDTQQLCTDQTTRMEELNQLMDELQTDIADKSAEIERLEFELKKTQTNWDNDKHNMEGEIQGLNDALKDSNEEIAFLSTYKKSYDDLYFAFLDKPEDEETPRDKEPKIYNKRNTLMVNIELAQKLEKQIMTVLNTAIIEFDKFLEEHKERLETLDTKEDITDAELTAQEIEIDEADQELEAIQDRFRNTIGDISNELKLLKQHSVMLMEQLQIIEEKHPTLMRRGDKFKIGEPAMSKSGDTMLTPAQEKRIKKIQEENLKLLEMFNDFPYVSNPLWKTTIEEDSILSAGLEENEEDDSDPFIPQERIFSKYAAMLYTSNNQGRSFEEFKEAKFCQSCGEKCWIHSVMMPITWLCTLSEEERAFSYKGGPGKKWTVICPHKLPGSERIFSLPLHCTHLKISRPKVKINREMIRELMEQDNLDATFDLPQMAKGMSKDSYSIASPTSSQGSPSLVGSETHLPYTVHSLLDDYKQRTNLERDIPRDLTESLCLSMVEQFWTYIIWQDDNGKEEEIHYSIIDKLYRYMEERYLVTDIMYLCTFDFINSVIKYADTDKTVQLFGNILAGNFEGACFRYLMLLCDFVCAVDWKEVEDFRAFAAVVYPFLGEDDLENLQMSYTSFSENKISEGMVAQFIIHLMLKYREPRFLEMENRLIPFKNQDTAQPVMSEKDFKDAIGNILPLTNDKLRRRLFFETEKLMRKEGYSDSVPIMRLSQIASYLGLLQITNIVRDSINSKIKEWRERPSSSGSARVLVDHESQVLHREEHLITMSKVKLLSRNISRRMMQREARYEAVEEQSDW